MNRVVLYNKCRRSAASQDDERSEEAEEKKGKKKKVAVMAEGLQFLCRLRLNACSNEMM